MTSSLQTDFLLTSQICQLWNVVHLPLYIYIYIYIYIFYVFMVHKSSSALKICNEFADDIPLQVNM